MALIFDSIVHSPSLCANGQFARLTGFPTLQTIAGSSNFVTFGFQENGGSGLTADDESGNGYDMTLSTAGLWSGSGWYQSFGRMFQAGMRGLGLVGVGGASALTATVPNGALTRLNGKTFAHWKFKILMNGTGGGGLGRVIDKSPATNDDGWRLRVSAANTLLFEVWDGVAWVSNSTGANIIYGFWHDLDVIFDGTLAGDASRLKLILNGQDVTTVVAAGIPATLSDTAMAAYVLNNIGLDRAWDGQLGFMALTPDIAESLVQAQSTIELGRLSQPTVANQITIPPGPGHYGMPEMDFDGAAAPNSDHLATHQAIPAKTNAGTILIWLSPDDFTAQQTIFAINTEGLATDEYRIMLRGDQAGDPVQIILLVAGATIWSANFPINILNSQINMIGLTSDGTTVRSFYNGEEVVLTDTVGANAGQWLNDAPDANVMNMGVLRRAALTVPYNGKQQRYLQYDRALAPITIQQIWQRGIMNSFGGRFYPDR